MSAGPQGGDQPRVVVGVAGGIAAYKAVGLVRELVTQGLNVTVIPTHSALKFVGLPTWEALSRNPVATDLFEGVSEVRHVALGQQADLVIVAPATAHTLASLAGGFAADLLGTTILATTAPVVLAPAMHTEMWENPAVQANVETLRSRGFHLIGPESGNLTGVDQGVGRMAEPADIAAFARSLLAQPRQSQTKIVISAGGTREPLDPVRYIGNRSTGRMGVALAKAALQRGCDVTLVAAHLEVEPPRGVKVVLVSTAEEMRVAMMAAQPGADIVVMAAAVADWVPAVVSDQKISKQDKESTWSPSLVRSPDIAAELGRHKPPGQLVVSFAAETSEDQNVRESRAREKLSAKSADVMVLNQVGQELGFGEVETAVTLFFDASPQSLHLDGTKISVAERLLEVLLDLR
jgi:phosphopantothenoylcysteine decarboxylase / phosphopantothenate---cysteine ligase